MIEVRFLSGTLIDWCIFAKGLPPECAGRRISLWPTIRAEGTKIIFYMKNSSLIQLAKLIRYYSLVSTTVAGSGHPSSCLSAADIMTTLMFGGFLKANLDKPEYENNDRLIFSKGHAAPLFYSLYAAAGKVSEDEMRSLRKFGSRLEGHPTMAFPYTEVPTGSLGQGLSVGVGMALNAKLDTLPYRTWVLLGDSEMAEGSVWEALGLASFYKLNNLIGILDVNRLGQSRETMLGHHVDVYEKRISSFGWQTIVVDGHNFEEIEVAFKKALQVTDRPVMIIAKTLKGKGVSFLENKEGWHGKPLSADELKLALAELGEVDTNLKGEIAKPELVKMKNKESRIKNEITTLNYTSDKPVATRKAYGTALNNIFPAFPNVVVLDGETSNSTYAEIFKKAHPEKYLEMFIAEQNMVGVATGLSRRGKIPFVSTFTAFFSRAFDQIRMSQYANANIKFVGSHAGVSIGEDGASQMGLEEIAMFRTLLNSVVLYPADAVSTEKLVVEAAKHQGNVYIQTTRKDTPILYGPDEEFLIGGSKTLRSSEKDVVTVVAAGITLQEALKAYGELQKEGISIRVIDLYSIKPLDVTMLQKAVRETKAIITVEDNFAEGGIGEAVATAIAECRMKNDECQISVARLAVRKMPKSGKPDELLAYEEINAAAIVKKVREILQ